MLVGGGEVPGKGWYFPPTVLTDVDHSMAVMSDESFGPIVGIQVCDMPALLPSPPLSINVKKSCLYERRWPFKA